MTHTSSCVLEICLMITHIHTPIPTFDCVAQHIFLFHVYRSVSLARNAALHATGVLISSVCDESS